MESILKRKDVPEDVKEVIKKIFTSLAVFSFEDLEKKLKDLSLFPAENVNPVFRISRENTLLYANSIGLKIISENGGAINDTVPEKWQGFLKEAWDSGKNTEIVYKIEDRFWLFVLVPISEKQYINIYAVDITKRKTAEERLYQYKHIISSSSDMMALLDKEYRYIAVNKAYLAAFKLTAEQVIGKTVASIFGETFFKKIITPKAEDCFRGETVHFKKG